MGSSHLMKILNSNQSKHKKLSLIILLLTIISNINNSRAQIVSGHYGPGLFGVKSAHGFPTGFSYLNVTHLYYAGEYKDNDGKISTLAKPINESTPKTDNFHKMNYFG